MNEWNQISSVRWQPSKKKRKTKITIKIKASKNSNELQQ